MSYRPNPNVRLQDLLDAVCNEFENVKTEASAYRLHKDESDHKFSQQTSELQKIKQTVLELEDVHRNLKEAFEQEVVRLKQEIEQRDKQLQQLQTQQQQQQQHQRQERTPSRQPVPLANPNGPPGPPNPPQQQHYAQKFAYGHSPLAQRPSIPQPNGPSQLPPPPQIGQSVGMPEGQPQHLPPVEQLPPNGTPRPGSVTTPKPQQHVLPPPPNAQYQQQQQQQQNRPSQRASQQQPIGPPPQRTASGKHHTPQPSRGELAPAANLPAGGAAASGREVSEYEANTYTVPSNQRAAHKKIIPHFLTEVDAQLVPVDLKKQMSDYYVLYNPALPRKVDVDLVHSLDHNSVVCCVRFSADGKYLATGCNKTTQVYSVETGELVARLLDNDVSAGGANPAVNGAPQDANKGGDLYIRSVCFSPDGKFLATGAEDKLIRIWDLQTRRIIKYLKGHEQDIYSLDFFPDGRKLVSGSGDRTVRIWSLTSGLTQLTLTIEDGVTTVAVSPDGKLIAAGSLDRTVRVWDAITGFLVERLDSENENDNGHKDSVYSVTFASGGKEIASGSLDTTVKLWSLNDLNAPNSASTSNTPASCEVTYVGHKDFVLSVCASPDGEYILSGSKDRGVIFWEKATGDPILMLQGHRNSVISVSVSNSPINSSGMFATGSGDCKAKIWKWTQV